MRSLIKYLLLASILTTGKALSQRTSLIEISQSALAGQVLNIYSNFPDRGLYYGSSFSYRSLKSTPASEAFYRPKTGFCLSYGDLGNRQVLGYGIGLQYEMHWTQETNSGIYFTQTFRPGVTYNNRPFDVIDNPQNIVVGSHFSALMTLALGAGYSFSDQLHIGAEASIWHSSNGHTALPNVGMNAFLGSLSLVYRFSNDDNLENHGQSDPISSIKNSLSPIIGIGYGVNEGGTTTRPVNGGYYSKQLITLGVGYRIKNIHRISIALEGYYDDYYWLLNSTQEWQPASNRALGSTALMLMFGHEYIYNRLSLIINGGINLYNPTLGNQVGKIELATTGNTIKRYVPGRFAIRYYLRHPWKHENNWYVQAGIKSNFGQADFLEFGAGWVISNR